MRPTLPNLAAIAVIAAAVLFGGWLRTSQLDLRPMHLDEAIQADRLGTLMEKGEFTYDPKDGHGPGLLYLAAPVALAKGAKDYQALTEPVLRLTPALCGIALIAACALFWRLLGPAGAAR